MGAMNLANKIAVVAEKEGHHPDLTIAWGKCTVEIWTHKINGLTESDFILAAKIDQL
jgi:4a-hydroxytetrahydrobiopterin dehydratase